MTLRAMLVAAATTLVLSCMLTIPVLAGTDESVQISDACDRVSFGQAHILCDPRAGGAVTLQQLVAAIRQNPGEVLRERDVLDWTFDQDNLAVRAGTRVTLKNVGGEFHTFTNVGSRFTLGCVPEVNALSANLGLPPAPDCSDAVFAATGVPAQTSRVVTITTGGKYICLIHPWMRTDVTVN